MVLLAAPAVVVFSCWGFVRLSTLGDRYPVASVPARPVAIVFGASVRPGGIPSDYLAGRLEVARTLYEEGKVSVVVVSGDNRARNYDEPGAMRTWLVQRGVPAAAVVRDPGGWDSWSTCRRAVDVYGVRAAVLVSQDYHLPRTLAMCRGLGMDAVGAGSRVGAGTSTWRRGALREAAADVEAVWDLVARPPAAVTGEPDDAVGRALAAAAGS